MHQFLSIPLTLRWLITLAFVALIVVLSVTPGKSQYGDTMFVWLIEHTPTLVQKLMHLVCYAAMTALFAWSLETIESLTGRLLLSLLLAMALGASLEWFQINIPGRFGTLMDVILNSIGAVLGLLVAMILL
mgnify:FL=1